MEHCKQLIHELKEQLQVSVQSEGQMRSMAEESQSDEVQELKSQHQMLSEQVRKSVRFVVHSLGNIHGRYSLMLYFCG